MREYEFTAGVKQIGEGIAQTVKSELRVAIPAGIIGFVWGGLIAGDAVEQAKKGFILGTITGWELSSQGDPTVQWYDWAGANLLNVLLMVRDASPGRTLHILLASQTINPKSFAGARKAIMSLF